MSDATPTELPVLPFAEPLPPRPAVVHREHTGERLAVAYPDAHALALEMIRAGESISAVAAAVGPLMGKDGAGQLDGLRKIVRGWIILANIDLTEIARLKAAMVRSEALDRAADLAPDAKVKDLGALAMVAAQAHQIERNLGGMPTEIKVSTKLTLEDLEKMRRGAGKANE